jgi:hypothetical protein
VAYDPWRDLRDNWPELRVVVEPMVGRLLGELRYPTIALRSGTSAAQQRCTLTHEIVHLERGVSECGPWAPREERLVHREAALRLIRLDDLVAALASCDAPPSARRLAAALDVDRETLSVRVALLTATERAVLRDVLTRDLWSVA